MDKLEQAILEAKSKYGKKVIQTTSDKLDATIVPTDIYEFDKASELGGCPLGKIIEVSGPPSCGKTTLSWQVASVLARKTGKKILFYDFEMNYSKKWLTKLNVPLDFVILAMPEEAEQIGDETAKRNMLSIEDAFGMMDILLKTEEFCAVIWDSVATSSAASSLIRADEKGLDADEVAATAKALEKCLRLCGPYYRKYGTTLFFINHQRDNLENMANPWMAKFGDKKRTPGGSAFRHHADIRLELTPLDYIKRSAVDSDGKKIQVKIGQNVKMKFIKNRVGEPFGEEIIVMRKGIGFDIISSLIKRAIVEGVVIRKSTGLTYLKDDENIKAPSQEAFWNLVYANPLLVETIKNKLNGGVSDPTLISKIDLTVGTRELSVKELLGTDKVEEEVIQDESPVAEVPSAEINLDSLLETKPVNPVGIVSNPSAKVSESSKEPEKKKRGRPPKSKQ